jgi:hypothetical protein
MPVMIVVPQGSGSAPGTDTTQLQVFNYNGTSYVIVTGVVGNPIKFSSGTTGFSFRQSQFDSKQISFGITDNVVLSNRILKLLSLTVNRTGSYISSVDVGGNNPTTLNIVRDGNNRVSQINDGTWEWDITRDGNNKIATVTSAFMGGGF